MSRDRLFYEARELEMKLFTVWVHERDFTRAQRLSRLHAMAARRLMRRMMRGVR